MIEAMESLVDNSLVRLDTDGAEPRFKMLETIRDYATEKLEASGEAEAVRRKHAEYFLGLAVRTTAELASVDRVQWLDRLEREEPNLRLALRWIEDRGDAGQAAQLGMALSQLWWLRGFPLLTSGDMQRVLRSSSQREAALALRSLPGPVRDEFTSNVSAGAARLLAEEIEGLRSAPASEVVAAQQRLTATIRRLHESGDIVLDWMSWFAYLAHLTPSDLQRVLRDVEQEQLALGLRGADDEIREKVLSNVLPGTRQELIEQIDRPNPTPLLAIEEAQSAIAGTIRRLCRAGEIAAGSTDEARLRETQAAAESARLQRVRQAGELGAPGC